MSKNKDQIKGREKVAEGRARERRGKRDGDKVLQDKGRNQRLLGEAQARFGDLKQAMKQAAKAEKQGTPS